MPFGGLPCLNFLVCGAQSFSEASSCYHGVPAARELHQASSAAAQETAGVGTPVQLSPATRCVPASKRDHKEIINILLPVRPGKLLLTAFAQSSVFLKAHLNLLGYNRNTLQR